MRNKNNVYILILVMIVAVAGAVLINNFRDKNKAKSKKETELDVNQYLSEKGFAEAPIKHVTVDMDLNIDGNIVPVSIEYDGTSTGNITNNAGRLAAYINGDSINEEFQQYIEKVGDMNTVYSLNPDAEEDAEYTWSRCSQIQDVGNFGELLSSSILKSPSINEVGSTITGDISAKDINHMFYYILYGLDFDATSTVYIQNNNVSGIKITSKEGTGSLNNGARVIKFGCKVEYRYPDKNEKQPEVVIDDKKVRAVSIDDFNNPMVRLINKTRQTSVTDNEFSEELTEKVTEEGSEDSD